MAELVGLCVCVRRSAASNLNTFNSRPQSDVSNILCTIHRRHQLQLTSHVTSVSLATCLALPSALALPCLASGSWEVAGWGHCFSVVPNEVATLIEFLIVLATVLSPRRFSPSP